MAARTARCWGTLLLLLSLAVPAVLAQSTVGEISGYVRDTAVYGLLADDWPAEEA